MPNFLAIIEPIAVGISWLDQHSTLSTVITGCLSGIFSVLFAIYLAQNWILRPKFIVDLRDSVDGTTKILSVNSLKHSFVANEVYFLIMMKKTTWQRGPRIRIKEAKLGWVNLGGDTQEKNIRKEKYVVLSMTVPQTMHPNSFTSLLSFDRTDYPIEIYYVFRTKFGPFPKNDSPKLTENGKLPSIKIF